MSSLLEEIRRNVPDAAHVFEDAGFKDDEIHELCYETIKDLFSGSDARSLLQRSRVWKLIQKSLEVHETIDTSSVSSASTNISRSSTPIEDLVLEPSTPCAKLVLKSPEYMVYRDRDLDTAAKSGSIPKELRHRLIRSTINNMQAAAYSSPFNRHPNSAELEEMAKSLVVTYPCLADPETGHGALFKQLRKRVYNVKPVCLKQELSGRKKVGKRVSCDAEEKNNVKQSKNEVSHTSDGEILEELPVDYDVLASRNSIASSADVENGYDAGIMRRHYNALVKECKKSKPNPQVVNQYLNKEFCRCREWLYTTENKSRCQDVIDAYPCFKNHVEIVEEARRCLQISENQDPTGFLNTSIANLEGEIETIIYYGVCKKETKHPRSPTLNAKIVYLLQNLPQIFPNKKAGKKAIKVIDFLQDNEDPELWCSQHKTDSPVMLVTANEALLMVAKTIVSKVDRSNLKEAFISFLGLFYLLDLDYPPSHELGFTILHFLLFGDKAMPTELVKQFNATLADYMKFKNDNQ